MKTFRKILFWCHLTAGVTAGLVILLMAVTGVLLTYEKQMTYWADVRTYDITPPSAGATPLPADILIKEVKEAAGVTPTSMTVAADPAEPVVFGVPNREYRGERQLYVDPYTGALLGEGSTGIRSFFRTVTELHRWIAMAGDSRALGRSITGAANLLFLLIVLSGLYLWFPRRWTREQLRNILWFRRGRSAIARHFNWHNVIGFWSLVPLILIVASGVVISYPWASDLVFSLAGGTQSASGERHSPAFARDETQTARGDRPGRQSDPAPSTGDTVENDTQTLALDALWETAYAQVPDWRRISLRLPALTNEPVVFTINQGTMGQPQKQARLTLDPATGAVVRWEPFSSNSPGRKARMFLRFAHTGEYFGIIGQTIAGLASLGAVFLVYTGLSLTWRRFRNWRKRKDRKSVTATRTARVSVTSSDGNPVELEKAS